MDISKEIVASLNNIVGVTSTGIPNVRHAYDRSDASFADNGLTGKLTFNIDVLNKETKNMALAYIAACEQHGI